MATVTDYLHVATWNIHEGVPVGRKSFDKDAQEQLIRLVSQRQIDVLCLQEVDFDGSGHSRILDIISSRTNLKYIAQSILSESSFFSSKCAGVAIASRFPLKETHERGLENPRLVGQLGGNSIKTFDKGLVSAIVGAPGFPFRAVSLHAFPFHLFGHYASDRSFTSIWQDLGAEISKLANYPLAVCGDFNTSNRDLVMQSTKVPLVRVIGDVPTYEDKPYDDILVSSGLRANSSSTIENFSDHRLCLAKLYTEVEYGREKEPTRTGAVTRR
jgi:endonuclease/exonuclease/phosphatase family metal-dependent hydrolase